MLDPDEAIRVLDLCDRVLGRPSQRGHRFAWLLESADPAADPARVDAWYPEERLVVDVFGRHAEEELHRRALIVGAYGLGYVTVGPADEAGVREQLEARHGGGATATIFGVNVGAEWDVDEAWEDDDEEYDDDEEWDDDDEPGEPRADEKDLSELLDGPLDSGVAERLGWRARSIALALVGALALSRRALRVDPEDHLPRELGLDVLLALAAAEARPATHAGLGADEIASALVLDPVYVQRVLGRLERDGKVLRGGIEEEGPDALVWSLSPDGLRHVAERLADASPLFRDWPRD